MAPHATCPIQVLKDIPTSVSSSGGDSFSGIVGSLQPPQPHADDSSYPNGYERFLGEYLIRPLVGDQPSSTPPITSSFSEPSPSPPPWS